MDVIAPAIEYWYLWAPVVAGVAVAYWLSQRPLPGDPPEGPVER